MPRYKLTIEYEGTGHAGWQRQNDMVSVQGWLEEASERLCGSRCVVHGAGRTDAGVHAVAQVAHIDLPKTMTTYSVMHGLNHHLLSLTSQVVVTKAQETDESFHARFSATRRRYFYRIINRQARLTLDEHRAWHIPENLNAEAMHEAAKLLLGDHDFSSFRSSECQAKSPLKTLDHLEVIRRGEEIHVHTHARSFLHHQVRNMVGTLRLIGNGKWTSAQLKEALAACDRRRAGENAPPQGLYLMEVSY